MQCKYQRKRLNNIKNEKNYFNMILMEKINRSKKHIVMRLIISISSVFSFLFILILENKLEMMNLCNNYKLQMSILNL